MSYHDAAALLPWQISMLNDITTLCQENVKKWMNVIAKLGVPDTLRIEWSNTFRHELETLLADMCQDVEDRELVTRNRINSLKCNAAELALQLGVPCMSFPAEHCLYVEEQQLKNYISKLEDSLEVRKNEISELQERQNKICTMLSMPCKPLSNAPPSSPEEIAIVREYVKSLENECFLREEEFCALQSELKKLAAEYDYRPHNDYERLICSSSKEDSFIDVTDKSMAALKKLRDEIRKHAEICHGEKQLLVERIRALWRILEERDEECEEFLRLHSGANTQDINACKEEFRRLEELKRANLKAIVNRLREKLVDLWDKCLCDESIREEFLLFHDNSPTDTVLQIYEHEVDRWSRHFNDNEQFFDTISKFKEAAKKMTELDAPAEGNKRFKNRGGQLLQEEKERKLSKKRIDKLEAALIQYANEYQANYGHEFQIDGLNIEGFINKHYVSREEAKMSRVNKLTPCAVKSLNVPTSSSISSRKSPACAKKGPQGLLSTSKSGSSIKSGAKRRVLNKIPHFKKMAALAIKDRDEMLNYCSFKEIVDTTMPSLIGDDTQNCIEEQTSAQSTHLQEEEDAVPLPQSPIAESINACTFSNVTIRRKNRDEQM